MHTKFFDISIPLSNNLPKWPGTPGFHIEKFLTMENGDPCNNSLIKCDVHVGTHVDAPAHFFQNAKGIDQINLELLLGRTYVAHLQEVDLITGDILDNLTLPTGIKRILFHTKNSDKWSNQQNHFHLDYVALSSDGAQWIVDKGFKLVGIDYLSIQPLSDNRSIIHKILLNNEVIIIEGLNLQNIDEGLYDLICLPLNIVGSDGAPARVVLRKL